MTVTALGALPPGERHDALEALVVGAFKDVLLMDDDEELPLDDSYFDLGFTSLRLMEVKERLEERLGCGISANVMFNRPTVAQLLRHLAEEAFPDLFGAPREPAAPAAQATDELWDEVLGDLYRP